MDSIFKASNPFNIDLSSYEDAAARVRGINEKVLDSSKAVGNTTLDAWDKALETLLGLEKKAAAAAQLDWVAAMADTHVQVVHDVNAACVKAAREMLSAAQPA